MNRAPETNPCVGAPTPDVVLPHFDAAPQLPDAARIAMRGDDVHDRELLNALRGTPRIAATAMSLVNNADASDESDDRSIYLDLTLREAIVLAGVEDWLRQIAYDHPAAEELCEQFTHMVATALSARALAANERRLRIEPADAFIAGLLHDVGKAAIAAVFPRAFQRIAAHAHEMRGDISDAERAMLGVDHAVVGRYVAERWGLPRKIRDVMWLHHLGGDALPSSIQQPQLVRLIRLADVLVREAHVGDSGNYRVYDTSRDLAARLHVDARRVENAQVALEGATLELLAKMGFSRRDAAGSALRPDREADSAVVIRQPNEQQTTFEAISAFNRACGECPDLRAAIRALAVSAAQALASDCVVAITFSEGAPFVPAVASRSGHVNVEFPARPLQHVGGSFDELSLVHAHCLPAPRELCECFAGALRDHGSGRIWFVPLCRNGLPSAAVLFRNADDSSSANPKTERLQEYFDHAARIIGLAIDCAQLQRLSDDLAEANRCIQHSQIESLRAKALSIIAEMAAGAGHELNSPLAVISGRAQMLAREFDDSDVRRSLEIIAQKAHECSQIVSELMDFARPRPPQAVEFDLTRRIRDQAATWATDVGLSPARLSIVLPDSLPDVRGDVEQIDLVLRELLQNATYAVSLNGGHIFITGRLAPQSDGVEISVRDTGCGMNSAVTQRAFDPFFSHREAGRGRGLGLPRAHRIIEAHGGRIWLDSTADEGTTARLFLPLATPTDSAGSTAPRIIRRVS